MFDAVVSQYRQRGSHADAVVGAQRGAARLDPLAVDIRLNRILGEVVHGVVIFLRHHIQVRLQGNRLTVFHAFGGRLAQQDIAHLIAFGMQILLFGPCEDVLCQRFFMIRRMRNRADFGKNIPQRLWRKLRQFRHYKSPVTAFSAWRECRSVRVGWHRCGFGTISREYHFIQGRARTLLHCLREGMHIFDV
ncbi:hypothetical protein D3C79_235260 [compost metagenome]